MSEEGDVRHVRTIRQFPDRYGGEVFFQDQGYQGVPQDTARPAYARIGLGGGGFTGHNSPVLLHP